MAKPKAKALWLVLACIATFVLRGAYDAVGRPQEVEVKDFTRESWERKRRETQTARSTKGRTSGSAKDTIPRPNSRYKVTRKMPSGTATPPSADDSQIGVTLWRLRPARTNDAAEIKDLVQSADGVTSEEWTPERVSPDTEFYEEQKVKLSIESLRKGFLYVINRAKYKDGTYGNPYLIFPTKRIYRGNNRVEAGRAIQIPGPDEQPFALERGKSRGGELQESEELIILVTPQALQSFSVVPPDRQKLTAQSVENLIKKYGTAFEISERIGGGGDAITVAEKQATRSSERRLGPEDPYPQTIYRLAAKVGDAMLTMFELKVRSKEQQ